MISVDLWLDSYIHQSRKLYPFYKIITVDDEIEKRAWEIFKKYGDQTFSYTDCTSFAVMQIHKLKTSFAFDTHFEIFGFNIAPSQKRN